WHTGTMTMRVPQLSGSMPHAYVEMHQEDARERGFSNGEIVYVASRRGRIKLPVWINGRAKPPKRTLFVPFFDERLLINEVTLGAVDPHSKEPDYKKCSATVCKLSEVDQLPPIVKA